MSLDAREMLHLLWRKGSADLAGTIATPAGFEPARGDPIGLAGRRLNHSAKVSYTICIGMIAHQSYVAKTTHIVNTDMGIERACDDLSAGPSIWHCPDMLGLPCGMNG